MVTPALLVLISILLLSLASAQQPADPTYDHQTVTYVAKTSPVSVTEEMTVTPFFSPDHSIDTETALVQSATQMIRVGIPGFDSWGNCTWASNTTYGCTPAEQRGETFPIFAALLNALHKGVTVQILTNNYSQPYYPGLIDPLGFLSIAGADVRSFTTVTFIHSKFISVDGKKAAVSSVNFSQTSFLKNREAGLLIEDSSEVMEFLDGVFDQDFAKAVPWVTISYVSPLTPVRGSVNMQALTSPDMAYETITEVLDTASDVQITDDMCDYISNHTKIFSTIFVSNAIFDKPDYESAKACYTRLYKQGLTIRKTAENVYAYSHQKYWIIDRKTLFVATGNWGGSDYPDGSQSFPPYSSGSAWRLTNRDFTIKIVNADIVAIFQKVLDEDYSRGWDWKPE